MDDCSVIIDTGRCTGGGCSYEYGHEPHCGLEYVDEAEECLSPSAVWDFSQMPGLELM